MIPLVTICLPVFNNERFLRESILSAINQTYPNIQIVAIDDCSTDRSFEILKNYESDNFIIHKNTKNLGLRGNWNKCLEMASGKYIKMMGADDILFPDCIEKQVAIMEALNVNLVSSNRHVIDSNGAVLLKLGYPMCGYIEPKSALIKLVGSGRNVIGEPVVCLLRKDALMNIGGFSALNSYVIDIETWGKLIQVSGFYAMSDYLSSFRISGGSTSAKEGFNQIRCVFEYIASYSNNDVGYLIKIKAYFLAVFFGLVRNIIFTFSNKVR